MFKVNSVCLQSSVFSFSVYQLCAGNTLMSATAVGDTRTISWFKPKSCVALDLPPLPQISAASEPISHTYGKIAAGVAVANFIFLPTAQHTSPLRYECSRNCKSRYSTRHFWLYHRNYCWVFSLHILTQHTTYSPSSLMPFKLKLSFLLSPHCSFSSLPAHGPDVQMFLHVAIQAPFQEKGKMRGEEYLTSLHGRPAS